MKDDLRGSNGSRVDSVLLTDYDEQHAPPAKVLRLSVIGDVVFLTIMKYSETFDSVGLSESTGFALKVDVLRRALDYAERDQ